MARLPDPLSRRDRQRQTREALVFAARSVFAEDGYHGASLDRIAREAGFSKGAVYSNFDGKAALFLAVMDANLEISYAEGGWDVFEQSAGRPADEAQAPEAAEAIRGFALATLEFIAAAAREPDLAVELGKRMSALTEVYAEIARKSRPEGETLPATQVGALLAALDQGSALLTLSGSAALGQQTLRSGMRRVLDPARAAEEGEADEGPEDNHALHDDVVRQRIVDAIREGRPS